MELELKKERDTPLLSRKRYVFNMTFEGPTPSRKDIRAAVAKKVNADKELTIIKHVYTRYGVERAKVFAHVYGTKEDMMKIEEPGVLKKHQKKEEKKEETKEAPAEAAPEGKKEEAPAEAPKEEEKSE